MDKLHSIPTVLDVDDMYTHFKLGREAVDKHIANGMPFFLTDPGNSNSHKKFLRDRVREYLNTLA